MVWKGNKFHLEHKEMFSSFCLLPRWVLEELDPVVGQQKCCWETVTDLRNCEVTAEPNHTHNPPQKAAGSPDVTVVQPCLRLRL